MGVCGVVCRPCKCSLFLLSVRSAVRCRASSSWLFLPASSRHGAARARFCTRFFCLLFGTLVDHRPAPERGRSVRCTLHTSPRSPLSWSESGAGVHLDSSLFVGLSTWFLW